MLKIGKGLKKKKKSKKNKHKEEELFTEAELEQYRKEHAHKAVETVEEVGAEGEEQPGAGKSEEFEKYKLLTAGVDDILRKSQGDLDRIKKESFFQRKPTPSEVKEQEEKDKATQEQSKGNWIGFDDGKTRLNDDGGAEGVAQENFEESESEYEFEENDELFDTAYVDALESGEVKLAYVPDDDEDLGLNDGPDPFDTSTAEEILKKVEEEERNKKKQISLGLAVNVLTGRAERDKSILEETGVCPVSVTDIARPRKRPRKIQDVSLLGSFDDNGNHEVPTTPINPEAPQVADVPKSLLDDDLNIECELPEGEALITEVLVKQSRERKEEDKDEATDAGKEDISDLVSEFDVINKRTPTHDADFEYIAPRSEEQKEEEDEFDEFAALAATSVANQKLDQALYEFESVEDDPFDTSSVCQVLKEEQKQVDLFGSLPDDSTAAASAQPLAPCGDVSKESWSKFDDLVEEDPFDTTFVGNVQPGKCELKLLENEILGDIVLVNKFKKDIHQEARILSRSNSDFDKDAVERKTQKISIHITDPSGAVETQRGSESEQGDGGLVSLSFSHRDLLGGSTTDLSKLADDPLPPSAESPLEDFSKYSDPFDTSIVDQVAVPGRAELKFIEKELLDDLPRIEANELDDDDFDVRAGEVGQAVKQVAFDVSPADSDLLSSLREEGARPLTPYYADSDHVEPDVSDIDDPFDTSYVTSLPGKQELKLIEKELEQVDVQAPLTTAQQLGLIEEVHIEPGLKHSLSDQDFNPREELCSEPQSQLSAIGNLRRYSDITGLSQAAPSTISLKSTIKENSKPDLLVVEEELEIKALTPAVEEDISSYIDPFDTSIAENIAPGKAELRVLEKELVDPASDGGIKRSYTDPDFNPRTQPRAEQGADEQHISDILSAPENATVETKPLTPVDFSLGPELDEDIDPFDTSIATNLLPGKAELRILESELFG